LARKKEENLRVLMEKGRKRPPAAFKLGGWGRGTFPECSFGDKQPNLANQRPPFCVRRFYTNQRRVDREK
tara:strand:- start:639 stop:848 length:210 start_codon:yes stop_codon:yes gene_type:complete